MRQLSMLGIVLVLLVAACGGNGNGSDEQESSAPTTEQQNTSETTGNSSESAASQEGPGFTVEITGDVDHSFSSSGGGGIVLNPEWEQGGVTRPAYFEMTFNDGLDYLVSITVPADISTGTHDLSAASAPGKLGASLTVAREPGNMAAGSDDYDSDVTGSITLDELGTEAGDTFSGNFEFTASSMDTNDSGEEVQQTVTVSGTFSDISLLIADQ